MQLRIGLALTLSALSLAGCSSMSINNGSLDYKNTTTLEPLKYPEGSLVRPATPLYPAPTVEQLAIDNAPKLENKRGNRFALPRPESAQQGTNQSATAQNVTETGRPQVVMDGNRNPLLKIEGNSATIWQYTLATLSSLNYSVVGQSKMVMKPLLKLITGHMF